MSEIVRFRIGRSPQRKSFTLDPLCLELFPFGVAISTESADLEKKYLSRIDVQEIHSVEMLLFGTRPVRVCVEEQSLTPERLERAGSVGLLPALRRLDRALLKHNNSVPWTHADVLGVFEEMVGNDLASVINDDLWSEYRKTLFEVLIALTYVKKGTPELRADVMRLLLIMGLVELAAERATELDADAVYQALRWRRIVLPPPEIVIRDFKLHSRMSRSPGFSDLYIVREEWARYEAGQIAHIENVLAHEVKKRQVERTETEEITITTEQEVATLDERDNQTTARFELKSEAETETALAFHIEGKVDTSGQYGPTHVDTHLGGTFDYSIEEATRRAVTQARETVERAVSKVEERISELRTRRTLTTVRTNDEHSLDNRRFDEHTVGIYRWVDKIQTVQIFKYPHRLLFEFEVPEPGSFLRWAKQRVKEGPFDEVPWFTLDGSKTGTKITPEMITFNDSGIGKINYLELASRYSVQGLEGPPIAQTVYQTVSHSSDDLVDDKNLPPVYSSAPVSIPQGYQATEFEIYGVATNAVDEKKPITGWFEIALGNDYPLVNENDNTSIWRFNGKGVFRDLKTGKFRVPPTGTLPILLATDDTRGLIVSIRLSCEPTEETVLDWQLKTFDLIQGAYWELRRQLDRAKAEASVQAGIQIQGSSPVRNTEVIHEELKRNVVELLLGSRFDGRPGLEQETEGPPRIKFDTDEQRASEIQFLEQAFEWENMSYILYPYYWANADEWADLAQIEGPDPEFARFLRAGSARVVLPARPGFEHQAQMYTSFGTLWGGGPTPVPDDDLYLSIADEIQAQQLAPKDGESGAWWEVRLPTTLVYLEPIGTQLPLANTNPKLPASVSSNVISDEP